MNDEPNYADLARLVSMIGAVWKDGAWELPYFEGSEHERMQPVDQWLAARRDAARVLQQLEQTQERVERVAQALWNEQPQTIAGDWVSLCQAWPSIAEQFRSLARVALTAAWEKE